MGTEGVLLRFNGQMSEALTCRLHPVGGKSPLAYFQDLRVEWAAHLLRVIGRGVRALRVRQGVGAH